MPPTLNVCFVPSTARAEVERLLWLGSDLVCGLRWVCASPITSKVAFSGAGYGY